MTPRLGRVSQALSFSLYYRSTTNFLSFLFPPFLKHLLSKTLHFLFSMDSLLFSAEDYDVFSAPDSSNRLSDLDDDPLYLVPFRWWDEARDALYASSSELNGVLYETRLFINRVESVDFWNDGSESEIVLDMRRENDSKKRNSPEEEGVSGGNYALVAEWMFLRALKWHNDVEDIGSVLVAEDNKQDLFPLQIRLSFSWETKSLIVKICQKDNKLAAFDRACDIFYAQSGLLRIWDFSGQTTQFFVSDGKLSNDSDQSDGELLLELRVYGLPYSMNKEERKEETAVERSRIEGSLSGASLKMNGSTQNVNSYYGVNNRPSFGSGYRDSCSLGLIGLYNLGNTCFMNSAIQCLVHTPKLVDYFLGDFRKDLNFENPLGMNGKLALAFGDLLRKLWAPGATPVTPRMFKSTLAGFAPQFSGYNQHDSQEFLAFLLDGLHEDLNRVKSKPYTEVQDAEGCPDEEVAEEHWRNHLARNDSIIVDVCQGQYRSTLVCPVCKKLSITFDPFMYLSLPLPSTTTRTMTLVVVSAVGTTLPSPVTITVPSNGRCKDLVQVLSNSCSLGDDERLLVAEIYNNRILRFLDDPFDSVDLIRDDDRLVAYRLPEDSDTSSLVVFMHQRVDKSIYGTPFAKKFGIPLVARISDFSKGSEIREQFLKLLNPFLMPVEDSLNYYDDAQSSANQDTEMEGVISTTISDGYANLDSESEDYSRMANDFQFFLMEENGLLSQGPKIRMNEPVPITVLPRVINVLVSWPDRMIELYDTSLLGSLPQICKPVFLAKKPHESVSLYKCLEAFLKEEPLGPDDMWYCPNCKKHQQASKKLDLWRLPEILVIHLKRFSYNRFFKDKLETFVDFPIDDFDLSTYIVHNNTQVSYHYTLYAVSNHYGGMGGGHYTAFVQQVHNKWYEFDDSHVSSVSEEQIKTSAAYVLFYRKISRVW